MEIDNAFYQGLESFGKREAFKMGMEKFWIAVWENSKSSKNGLNLQKKGFHYSALKAWNDVYLLNFMSYLA